MPSHGRWIPKVADFSLLHLTETEHYFTACKPISRHEMTTVRFTDIWIKSASLVPKEGRAEYIDGLCPGLHLRITYRGVRTFSAMFRINGKLTRQTIGRYPVVTIANARATALQMMREAQAGVDSREHRSRARSTLTYVELVEAYNEKHLIPNVRSGRAVYTSLKHDRMKPFFKRPVGVITRREILDLIDKMVADGLPQGAVNHLGKLKTLFSWAVGRDLIQNDPTQGLKPPVRMTERDRVLSDGEIVAVWKATHHLPAPYGAMYRMFMLTGQRRTEVSRMQWNEIVGSIWTIPRERVKKDRPHAVPLSGTALAALAALPVYGENAYVFSTTGGERPSSNYNKIKRELDRLSGTSGWTIHDLRRTVRSKLAELRVPEVVARKVLNHEAGKVDRIYNRHDYLREKREALAKWEKRLLALVNC